MKLKLLSTKVEQDDVHSFVFEPETPITWQPGQYMHYVLQHPQADTRGVERWFTISSAPFEGHIMLTTRLAGSGSSFKKALMALKEGDTVEADGPKGSFTIEGGNHRHVLIAGGIGITPYRSMMLQLYHEGKDPGVELFYASREPKPVFEELFLDLQAKLKNFRLRKFTGGTRIVAKDLKGYLDKDDAIYYISGPRPMSEGYQHLLQALKVPDERIKTDYFPGYDK